MVEQQQNPVYVEKEVSYVQTPVSVGDWMITLLIMYLPIINIIMLFVWAFSGNINVSKANWAKATLIWILISIILFALLSIFLWGVIMGLLHYNY